MKEKDKQVAFFDFCETLVNFQTADAFVDFVRESNGNSCMKFLNSFLNVLKSVKIIAVLNKLFSNTSLEKRLKLLQLRRLGYEELNFMAGLFYQNLIRPNLIGPLITELQRLRQHGYEVCLVSAGYSIYLKYFAEEYQIKHLISNEVKFSQHRNYCLGTILGRDCIHSEKVKRIETYYENQNIDFNKCISYSDSISDLPMLLLTGEGVVVSRGASQAWCNQYKLKEIVWDSI